MPFVALLASLCDHMRTPPITPSLVHDTLFGRVERIPSAYYRILRKALQWVCALQTVLIPDDVGKFFRILEH